MDNSLLETVTSIIDGTNDMTLATVRKDGFPQATTVSYVNDGLTIYFVTSRDSQKANNIADCNKISLTIDPPYANWDEITGISLGGYAELITDKNEIEKVGELVYKKFPQVAQYMPENNEDSDEVVFFCIKPVVISLLDYRKGFGHTELIEL